MLELIILNIVFIHFKIIKHALELYGFNTKYMTSNEEDEQKANKLALISYTYNQVISSQAEQVNLNSDVEIEDNDITCFDEILKELLTEENNIDQNQKEENNENDNEVKFRIV